MRPEKRFQFRLSAAMKHVLETRKISRNPPNRASTIRITRKGKRSPATRRTINFLKTEVSEVIQFRRQRKKKKIMHLLYFFFFLPFFRLILLLSKKIIYRVTFANCLNIVLLLSFRSYSDFTVGVTDKVHHHLMH